MRDGKIERPAEGGYFGLGDFAEERPDDDRLGQSPHLAHQLEGLTALGEKPPPVEHLGRRAGRDGDELSVLAWQESGLHLPAPLPPAFIVHEGEAVAEERGHAGGGRTL